MSSVYEEVGAVLSGVEIPPLAEGVVALEAVVLVKALDADGNVGWWTRYSKDLRAIEVLGALHAALLLEEDCVRDIYEPMTEDGDV